MRCDLVNLRTSKKSLRVGDTLGIRVGTRFSDVDIYLLIKKNGADYQLTRHVLTNGSKELSLVIDSTMLGGIQIEAMAVKANEIRTAVEWIDIPYGDKRLEVEVASFRDKLSPGSEERWTVRVRRKVDSSAVRANVMMSMYDRALDSYGPLVWNINPWGARRIVGSFYDFHNVTSGQSYYGVGSWNRCDGNSFGRCSLRDGITGYHSRSGIQRMYKTASNRALGTARGENGIVEEEVLCLAEEGEAAVASAELSDVIAMSEESLNSADGGGEQAGNDGKDASDNPQVRSNLSTLAFFEPTLRTGEDGSVEYSFTVPDLLTEWQIKALAWDKDMSIGSLNLRAVTHKNLMVVPNVPRFLRHGDTCLFSVKVQNADTKEQDIVVTLQVGNDGSDFIVDANTPTTSSVSSSSQNAVFPNSRSIHLAPMSSGEVSFPIAIPHGSTFVTNYTVIARGDGCSDGEQGPIPLLPARQLVTESMSFYINGAGEKHCELDHLSHLDTSGATLRHYALTVDMTPNPLWLAIQSLPYLQSCKNPSNTYLANSIYANSLGLSILNQNPMVRTIIDKWSWQGGDIFASELDRLTDVKQTVMEETPWLLDAVSEEQQYRDVAQFLNEQRLSRQNAADLKKLLDAQRGDGSWSWIPGGRYPSYYTTLYILGTFGRLQASGVVLDRQLDKAIGRALDYVDREEYMYYKKYVKGTEYEPVNLEYLYVRSLFGNHAVGSRYREAYDFFYANAKKHNKSVRSLYSQAELAMVFHRRGDKALAREMMKRISQKSLTSDEMGMYWRDNVAGMLWSERPIETQAMLIRAMAEITDDTNSVALMQQWLLKQKQTTRWSTDVATTNAVSALLINGHKTKVQGSNLTLRYGSHVLGGEASGIVEPADHHGQQMADSVTKGSSSPYQLHYTAHLSADEITPADGRVTITKKDGGIAWGAMYWQYFEDVDKIPSSSMGISMKRTMFRVNNDGTLHTIESSSTYTEGGGEPLIRNGQLRVGDKVRIRIELSVDRNLEYLELKDPRCAAMEPVSTASGWNYSWADGLSYYLAVTNAAQTIYIDRLEKGNYVVEYDLYVNNAGTYTTAPTTIQCLYAPEFRATCPVPRLTVKPQK